MNIPTELVAPSVEMVEKVARAICRHNYPGASELDVDEMWDGWAGDARAALSVILPEGWQPIGTAPKDGTTIIAGYLPSQGPFACRSAAWKRLHHGACYDDEPWASGWVCENIGAVVGPFTHWMPLPAAPISAATSGKEGGR